MHLHHPRTSCRWFLLVQALLVVLPVNSMAQPTEWQIEPVEAPPLFANMTDRSLCLDSAGRAHLAFGQDHLYHARHDGTTWVVETVDDSPGVGEHASIAAGNDETLHIAYHDGLANDLKYARHDGFFWSIEVVGSGGTHTSVVLDSLERPRIAYQNETLHYAWKDDEGWHIEAIGEGSSSGGFASLALDQSGRPRISHYEAVEGDLCYSFRDSAGWHTEAVDSTDDVGWYSSMAVDSAGVPCVSYYDRGEYTVNFATRDSTAWQIQSLGRGGSWTSLGLDSRGIPHIAFCTTSGSVHAYLDSTTWITETLAGTCNYTALAIGHHDEIHMSYVVDDYFAGLREFRHALRQDSSWSTSTVAAAADVGTHAALATDYAGFLHACYVNSVDQRIRCAAQTTGGWVVETMDLAGIDLSLALDGTGVPHMAVFDEDANSIIHAWKDEAAWKAEPVDTNAAFGGYTSVAIDGDDGLHLAYRADRKPTYAHKADSAWVIESLGPDEGFHTSMVLDALGYPHLAHHSGENHLAYTYRDATGWHTEVVDASGEGGFYCSLALDAAGVPHIAHFDNFFANLRYAYKDTAGWHRETIDPQTNMGKHASLALDPRGTPFVTCLNGGADDLKFAYRDGGVWRRSTIASEGSVGEWAHLVIDDLSHAHVIYYDATRGDLMYAHADALEADPWDEPRTVPQTLRIVSVSPNPAPLRGSVLVRMNGEPRNDRQSAAIRLFDIAGREVYWRVHELAKGLSCIPLPLTPIGIAPLSSGTYYLQVRVDGTPARDGIRLIILP